MRRSQRDGLKAVLTYDAPLLSPVTKGQVVGKVTISIPNAPPLEVPVSAGADVEDGGLMKKIRLGVAELFSGTPEPTQVNKDVAIPQDRTAAAQTSE